MTSIVVGDRPAPWPLRFLLAFILGCVTGIALCDTPPREPDADAGCVERPGEHCECWPTPASP